MFLEEQKGARYVLKITLRKTDMRDSWHCIYELGENTNGAYYIYIFIFSRDDII